MDSSSLKQKYGRYQVVKLLGEGAMGRVYLAEDPVLDRLVALKIIALKTQTDHETKLEYIKRFNLEAKASARLNHPSIVTIYDAGEDEDEPWIAFEFVNGMRLDQFLRAQNQVSFEKVRTIATQLASALLYAHDSGIIHRDIKPQNILIDERTSIAKLADFGVAKAPWAGFTREGNCVGSPGYMSPEQIDGGKIDTRSDLFSFGIVLYELITGKHPFIKESIPATFFATVNGQYLPIHQLRSDVPQECVALVCGLLQADREKRFQSAREILNIIGKNDQAAIPGGFNGNEKTGTFIDNIKNHLQRLISHQRARLLREICVDLSGLAKKILKKLYKTTGRFAGKTWRTVRRALSRNLPVVTGYLLTHKKTAFALALSLVVLLFIPFVVKPSCSSKKKNTVVKGSSIPEFRKVKKDIDQLFSANLFDSLKKTTDQIIEKHGKDPKIALVQARLALKEGDFSSALSQFTEIVRNGGSRFVKEEREVLAEDIEGQLSSGEASEELQELCIGPLQEIIEPHIEEWGKHTHYWVRWNTVDIGKKLGRDVDMVEVYILDLLTGGSIRTRIRAAEKLGESGDKRAIAPLEEVSRRGFRDPIVSTKATRVLEEYFH
jgi:serine/threonine protein kinase